MFSWTTAHHISCTNCIYCNWTVLQLLNRSCCYMFSCTSTQKVSSWCLLKCSAADRLILHLQTQTYIYTECILNIQMTVHVLPPIHNATQHEPLFASSECKAANCATHLAGCVDVIQEYLCDPEWCLGQKVTVQSALPCHLLAVSTVTVPFPYEMVYLRERSNICGFPIAYLCQVKEYKH